MTTKEEIQKLISAYFVEKPVLRAYLFGSYARGEEDSNSDIDVLVELDFDNGGDSFSNYCRMMDDLQHMFGRKVDLLSTKGLSRFVKPYIDQDKILVYENRNS